MSSSGTILASLFHLSVFYRDVMSAVRKNKEHQKANETYNIVMGTDLDGDEATLANRKIPGQMDNIIDIR